MVPRRNPEFAVVVLQEHGDFGSGSAKLAAQIITAYVNKKRRQDGNLILQADKKPSSVEVGAVWSTPGSVDSHPSDKNKGVARVGHPDSHSDSPAGMAAGRFEVAVDGDASLADGSIFPDRSHRGQGRTSGAKARVDSLDFVPGMNPRPTQKPDSPAAAEVNVGLPERVRRVVAGGTR
jgi:hypothetical protein